MILSNIVNIALATIVIVKKALSLSPTYNPKGTTAQLHEVDTGTENPKIPFYRFFLHVKYSSHCRKMKQRNEQRRPDILEVFHTV